MNNNSKDVNPTTSLFLNSLTSLGTLIAAASPLFVNFGPFNGIFIDQQSIAFASAISIIAVILIIWYGTSINSFILFGSNDFAKLSKRRFYFILFFIISSFFFYLVNIIYKNSTINFSVGSVFQFLLYIAIFVLLAIALSISIFDTLNQMKYAQQRQNSVDLIAQVLIKQNLIDLDLKVKYIRDNSLKYPNSFECCLQVRETTYEAIISNDYMRILEYKEIILENNMNDKASLSNPL